VLSNTSAPLRALVRTGGIWYCGVGIIPGTARFDTQEEKELKTTNKRLQRLRPYPFAELNTARDAAIKAGMDVIDMGVGNPDMRPHPAILEEFESALEDEQHQNHRYPPFHGIPEFRAAIADWYKTRFNVNIDSETEVLPLVGSKEGIAKFFLSYMDPGEVALVTSPCYPAYLGAVAVSDGTLFEVEINPANGFHPDLESIPGDVLARAEVLLINYPNNPTGAVETRDLYERVLAFARKHDLLVVSDIAYAELNLDPGYRSLSFLEISGAKERAIEFYSFSKTYSMPGWRLGFVVGNSIVVRNLLNIKTNMDFGVFMAMQRAGGRLLEAGDELIQPTRDIYRKRRDAVMAGLDKLGMKASAPLATLYVWASLPEGYESSMDFAKQVLSKTGVVFAPGKGFGTYGEGFVRISLIEDEARITEAVDRIAGSGLV
jgi:LL-diaminopimelate aminotransferase